MGISKPHPTAWGQPLLSGLEIFTAPPSFSLNLCISLSLSASFLTASCFHACLRTPQTLFGFLSILVPQHLFQSHLSLSVSDPVSPQQLQQENHELRRGLAARGAEWEARAVELEGDVEALRAQLGEQRSEQQDSGRERARALSELSEQNLRLSQQLAQVRQP